MGYYQFTDRDGKKCCWHLIEALCSCKCHNRRLPLIKEYPLDDIIKEKRLMKYRENKKLGLTKKKQFKEKITDKKAKNCEICSTPYILYSYGFSKKYKRNDGKPSIAVFCTKIHLQKFINYKQENKLLNTKKA